MDLDLSAYLDQKDQLLNPIIEFAESLSLTPESMERIAVHAYRRQEGGMQYLRARKLTDDQINSITLTESEQKMYDLMREKIESVKEEMKSVLREVYNQEIEEILNYFPVKLDANAMDEMTLIQLAGDKNFDRLTKNVKKGFTLERLGTDKPIKLNAMEIIQQHLDEVAYFINMAEDVKLLREITNTEEYHRAAGGVGQRIVLEWLDVVARKGGADGAKKIEILDTLRRNFGAAALGFKLSSILIQPTALFDGAARIGGKYAFGGYRDLIASRANRQFLLDNFPKFRDRGFDDPAFLELSDQPTLAKWQARGFWALQKADFLTAGGITFGAYKKSLDEQGIPFDINKPNQQAILAAQRELTRSQSSAFAIDAPLALTRGALTGNRSVDRAILQFQSFMLTRWSQIRHDMWRAGFASGDLKQAGKATRILAYLSAASVAEAGIRAGSSALVLSAILEAMKHGDWDEILDAWDEEFEEIGKDIAYNTLSNVPFIGQQLAGVHYQSQVIPSLEFADAMRQGLAGIVNGSIKAIEGDDEATEKLIRAAIHSLEGLGGAVGIPGTLQSAQIARRQLNE